MRRNLIQTGKVILALVMTLLISTNVYAGSLEDAQQDKDDAEDKKSQAEEILQQLESEKEDLQVYMTELDGHLSELQGRIDELNVRRTELESEIAAKQEELEQAKIREEEQYQAMCTRIQFMYENSDASYMNALLSAESMCDVLNESEYAAAMTEYDYDLLNQMAEVRTMIAEAENTLRPA